MIEYAVKDLVPFKTKYVPALLKLLLSGKCVVCAINS